MQKILIMNDFDITKRPRPARLVDMLKEHYKLYAIAPLLSPIEGVQTFSYPAAKRAKERSKEENLALYDKLRNDDFIPLIFTKERLKILDIFKTLPQINLIIIEDITLLPFGIEYIKQHPQTRLMIDLREYYPLEYEGDPKWMSTFGKFFQFLCEQYLKYIDVALCVSEGIAKRYKKDFNLDCIVFYSLPPFHSHRPSPLSQPISLIYHGFLSTDRNSQNLIELARLLDRRFHLYIMGLSNQAGYIESLKTNMPNNISFINPVEMNEIINFTQQFDIGLLTLSPNSFNNANAMPNKFFEYIQARLGIISTPIPSITPWIKQYKFGKCAQGFEAKDMAECLNKLSDREILDFKMASNKIASKLSMLENQKKILNIIKNLLNDNH